MGDRCGGLVSADVESQDIFVTGGKSCEDFSEVSASVEEMRSGVEACLQKGLSVDRTLFPCMDDLRRRELKKSFLETEARISRCARKYGWKFFAMPVSELQTLETFLATRLSDKPQVKAEYLQKVARVKAMFVREFEKIGKFFEAVERFSSPLAVEAGWVAGNEELKIKNEELRMGGAVSPSSLAGEAEWVGKPNFDDQILAAAQHLDALENGDLVAGLREEIFNVLRKIRVQGFCGEEDREEILAKAHVMQGLLRYMIEAQEGTYRSGRFSADYFARVLGFRSIQNLFFREDGERRTIVDLGCGDGDMMVELARVYRTWVRGSVLVDASLHSLIQLGAIKSFPSTNVRRDISEKLNAYLRKKEFSLPSLPEPIDPQFIGVDQTRSFPANLCDPQHGVSGRRGDICAPWETFQKQTGILPESIDVVTTTLTLDRAYSIDNMFGNISRMLREDGRCMIATKGLVKAESDGQGGQKYKIVYGSKILTSNTYEGTLKKLSAELQKHGLTIETLSCHPCLVSSSDCYPEDVGRRKQQPFSFEKPSEDGGEDSLGDAKKYGPQEYQLMVVGGRKINDE